MPNAESTKLSDINKSHVSARSLTRIPEPEYESSLIQRFGKRHQSTSSINNNHYVNYHHMDNDNVKFESVKVYTQMEPPDPGLLESINLEAKDLLGTRIYNGNNNGTSSTTNINSTTLGPPSRITEMRRHTHYCCHIPSSMTQKPS